MTNMPEIFTMQNDFESAVIEQPDLPSVSSFLNSIWLAGSFQFIIQDNLVRITNIANVEGFSVKIIYTGSDGVERTAVGKGKPLCE